MAQDPRALMAKADKLMSTASGGFSFFGGKQDKFQDAADLYTQAANAYRMQNMAAEAGAAFETAADIYVNKLKEPDDAANVNLDAYKVYRGVNPEAAARCLNKAVQHYCSRGNFRRAATQMENLGDMYESSSDVNDPNGAAMKQALQAYEQAAGWYNGDNAPALANKLYLKVADIAALQGDYYKAIEQYEKVAQASINNNLMRYSVKDYFLKAGMCHMATKDNVATQRALDQYREMDPTFPSTREHQLLIDLLGAVEAGDQEMFTDKLYQYDQVSRLDKWKTAILVRVKNQIEEADNEFS